MHVVFDLDGTLANTSERDAKFLYCPERGFPHVRPNADWDGYFKACPNDLPFPATIAVFEAMVKAGHRVEIWTARSNIVRDETVAWLSRYIKCHFGFSRYHVPIPLIMRRVGDRTNDDVLKSSWVSSRGRPDLIFEDRNRVVAKWRALGIPCFQVADGPF